jgi:hypothetical protein
MVKNKRTYSHFNQRVTLKVLCSLMSFALISWTNNGHCQNEESGKGQLNLEMATMDIPEIGAKLNIPTSWSIWTTLEAKAAVEKVKYPTEEAKQMALKGAEKTGSENFRASRYIEPYNGINPTLTIAWSNIDPSLNIGRVPKSARSEVCSRTLKNDIIPNLTQFSKEIEVLEPPTPIDNKGTGAWVTIKETVNHNISPDKDLEVITRIYLLMSDSHFVLVTASFSNKDDKEAGINKEILGTIMKSLSIGNP